VQRRVFATDLLNVECRRSSGLIVLEALMSVSFRNSWKRGFVPARQTVQQDEIQLALHRLELDRVRRSLANAYVSRTRAEASSRPRERR